MNTDHNVDVAIVGGGGCGMLAALRAARNPTLTIGIFEKSTRHGCNTQFSSGSLAAGGTRYQRAAGVEDSPERHAHDILTVSGDRDSASLVYALCYAAPRYVEWLADELGHPIELGTDMARAGQSLPRLHTDSERSGGARLVRNLRRAVQERDNIVFADGHPAIGLLSHANAATGVQIQENRQRRRIGARAVLLAADGFAANTDMLQRHCPEAPHAIYRGVSTSTGESIAWGKEIGATTSNMTCFLGHGLVVPRHGTRLNPVLPFLGALLVDVRGRRFVDEQAHGYSKLGRIIAEQPQGEAVLLWDQRAQRAARHSELMRESARARAFKQYDTLAELVSGLALPEADLAQTLRTFRSYSTVDHTEHGPLQFPLYAARVTRGLLTTQGGLTVDTTGRVLHRNGHVIPGLYAGGGTAAGISGPSSDGYMSGNGLLTALGFGWIIGNHLAAQLDQPTEPGTEPTVP